MFEFYGKKVRVIKATRDGRFIHTGRFFGIEDGFLNLGNEILIKVEYVETVQSLEKWEE